MRFRRGACVAGRHSTSPRETENVTRPRQRHRVNGHARGATRGADLRPTLSPAGVGIPDTALAAQATELVGEATTDLIFDHSRVEIVQNSLWAE